jgi:hypothetical protein
LSALADELKGMPESQLIVLSAEAEDATAAVASAAAAKVIRILMVSSPSVVSPAFDRSA